MANPFVHVELATTDLERAKEFYGQLFSWKLEDTQMPVGTYTTVSPGDGTGGGMMTQLMEGAGSAWLPYVIVDNIRESTDKAKALGATIQRDVTEIPGMGSYSILTDPTGAAIGLWQMA